MFSDPAFARLSAHFAASPREFRWLYEFQVGGFIRNDSVRARFVPLLFQQFEAEPSTVGPFLELNADLTPAVVANTQRESELRTFSAPVRFAFGEQDPYLSPAHAHSWAKLLPNAEVRTIAGAGHFPQLDTPDEVAGRSSPRPAPQADRLLGKSTSLRDASVPFVREWQDPT